MASRRRRDIARAAIGLLCTVGFVESAESDGLKWIECCVEGTFLGHPKFPRIDWTPEVFQVIVDNLHRHPGFKVGPDGVGCARVIPWDYEHANEIAKIEGRIPADGLPSVSWTYDLKIENGADGKSRLLALTEWLPAARQQIQGGGYQGCSVCVAPKFIDPVSGKDQGPTLTSIALTNDPFVQGMEPLAATLEQYGPAESALEVLVGIRSALELPEDATAQQAIEQLNALFDAITNDKVPEYVEEGWILDRVRRLLKLPLLATVEDILGGAVAALNQLITGEGTAQPISTPTPTEIPMAATAFQTGLAAILNCKDDDSSILQAAKQAAAKAEKAEVSQAAAGALDQLKTLFGSKDIDDLLKDATKTIADAKALEPAVATLTEMRNALKATAENEAKEEAEAVAASMSGGDANLAARFRPVILAARVACIDEKTGQVDATKLEKFRADYPLPEEQRALLTRRVVAGPNGVQLGGSVTGYQTQPITQTGGSGGNAGAPAEVAKVVAEFNAAPGRNPVEKANHVLCTRVASHKSLDYAEQCRRAGDLVRNLQEGKLPPGLSA